MLKFKDNFIKSNFQTTNSKVKKGIVDLRPRLPRTDSVQASVTWGPYRLPERSSGRALPWRGHCLFDVGQKASLGFGLCRGHLGQLRLQRCDLSVLLLQDSLQSFGLHRTKKKQHYEHLPTPCTSPPPSTASPDHWPSAEALPRQICQGSHLGPSQESRSALSTFSPGSRSTEPDISCQNWSLFQGETALLCPVYLLFIFTQPLSGTLFFVKSCVTVIS